MNYQPGAEERSLAVLGMTRRNAGNLDFSAALEMGVFTSSDLLYGFVTDVAGREQERVAF